MSDEKTLPSPTGTIAVLVASVGFALTPVFTLWMMATGAEAEVIAFQRFAVTAILFLPLTLLALRRPVSLFMSMLIGVGVGLAWTGYMDTLDREAIATTGIYYLSYPLFAVLLVWAVAGVIPGTLSWIAAILAGVAIWLVTDGPMQRVEDLERLGLALAAPIAFAFALAVQRRWLGYLSPLQRIGGVSVGACIGLAPLVIQHPPEVLLPTPENIYLILGMSVLAMMLPYLVLVVLIPRMGTARAGLAASIELPAMVGFGWLWFGETIGQVEALAIALVVLGLIFCAFDRSTWGRPPGA